MNIPIKRLSFDLVELMRALMGFPTSDEGVVVIPKDVYHKLLEEAERLQDVEEAAIELHAMLAVAKVAPPAEHPAMRVIGECYHAH